MTSSSKPLTPNTPVDQAVDALSSARIVELETLAEAARRDPAPECIHAMRVAARQMRFLLRLVRPECDADDYHAVRAALTGFIRVLGAVRDRDVLREGVAELRDSLPPDAQSDLDDLDARLAKARDAALDEQRRYLIGDRQHDAIRAARDLIATREPNARTVAKWGRRALRKAMSRVIEAEAALGPEPEDDALHGLRKEVRRLRYLTDFLKPVLRKPGRRLRKRAQKMQDLLGRHQDIVVLKRECRAWTENTNRPNAADVSARIDAVLDEHRRRVREEIKACWREDWSRYEKRKERRFIRREK